MPKPLFEDFQQQVFEDPDVFFSGQQVSLNNFAPIFSTYSVVCRNCMIGVTLRTPMLEN
jgi:hypothetical protein